MLDPIIQLAQVGAMILVLIICVGVLIFAVILFPLFSSLQKPGVEADDDTDSNQKKDVVVKVEETPVVTHKRVEREFWEKYPQVYYFEILYWRGVKKTWWWNNYAKELVAYAREYLPHKKLDFYADYNSNSSGDDYPIHKNRIKELKLKKLTGHPLVVINQGKEMYSIQSQHDYEKMLDRIDAEWYRHYKFKKTWRK